VHIFRSFSSQAAKILKGGGVGVVPTDTLYGISASIFFPEAIARIYRLRRRNPQKPLIVLISSFSDLKKLGVRLRKKEKTFLKGVWPGKVSVVLRRGKSTVAVRLPKHARLRAFLKKTGPLVSTSVNPEGLPPAKTIAQAKKYFGDKLDFYIDLGRLDSLPSTLVSLQKGKLEILRPGAARIKM
jgi:L-threonylcarbamoyladenylate synthase